MCLKSTYALPPSALLGDVGLWRRAHAAHETGAEIREDVAEHVLGDQDVEFPECKLLDPVPQQENEKEGRSEEQSFFNKVKKICSARPT